MKQIYPLLFTAISSLSIISAHAQDKIYFQSEIKDGRVVEFTPDKIKFKNPLNPGPVYTVSRSKVLLVFNNAGGYLVIPKLGAGDESAQQNFINAVPVSTDRLITLQNNVIDVAIQREDETTIYYTAGNKPGQIAKTLLAAVIYKNGQHKLFIEVAKVLEPLWAAQQILVRPENSQTAALPANTPQTAATTASFTSTPAVSVAMPESVPATDKTTASVPATTNNKPTARNPKKIDELGEVSFAEYEKKALDKTHDLSNYLKKLCDKNVGYEEANKAIDQAVDLFVNEDALVETSSKNSSKITRYKIRQYLNRVKLIQYNKVEIEWTNIQYVSKLRKGPDGNYYGTITFEQVFRGYSGDNQLSYSDVTRKSVEIMLKANTKNVEGKSIATWDVFLSEVKVVDTKA